MEQREDEEMKELKAMLFGKPKAPAKSAPKQTETLPASPLTGLVFAEDKAAPVLPVSRAPAVPFPAWQVPSAFLLRHDRLFRSSLFRFQH